MLNWFISYFDTIKYISIYKQYKTKMLTISAKEVKIRQIVSSFCIISALMFKDV